MLDDYNISDSSSDDESLSASPFVHGEWRVLVENTSLADCKEQYFTKNFKTAWTLSSGGPSAKVSSCCIHENCNYQMKMTMIKNSIARYQIYERNQHVAAGYHQPVHGLNKALLMHVDPLLDAGLTPGVVVTQLSQKFKNPGPAQNMDMFRALPPLVEFRAKVTSRAAQLKKVAFVCETIKDLEGYLAERHVDLRGSPEEAKLSLAAFLARYEDDENEMMSLCQFDVFVRVDLEGVVTKNTGEGTKEVRTQGFVFSSPAILNNTKIVLRDQIEGISLAMDGTYKLLHNNWVLVVLGTHTVNYTTKLARNSYESHTTIPLLYCLVRTECQPCFEHTLNTFRQVNLWCILCVSCVF